MQYQRGKSAVPEGEKLFCKGMKNNNLQRFLKHMTFI